MMSCKVLPDSWHSSASLFHFQLQFQLRSHLHFSLTLAHMCKFWPLGKVHQATLCLLACSTPDLRQVMHQLVWLMRQLVWLICCRDLTPSYHARCHKAATPCTSLVAVQLQYQHMHQLVWLICYRSLAPSCHARCCGTATPASAAVLALCSSPPLKRPQRPSAK